MTKPSIRRKLRLAIVLTSAIVLLLACGAFIAADRARASRVVEDDLSTLAKMIGSNSAAPLTFDDRVAGTEVLSALRVKPAIVAAVMYSRTGEPFATYGHPAAALLRGVPAPHSSADRIEVVQDIYLGPERVGAIYIASDLRDAAARLRSFAGMTMLILIVSLAVAFLLSWRLEHLIAGPILELAGVAQQVTLKRNYSIRVAAPAGEMHDEIGALMIAFNGMLTEIQRRDDELQRHQGSLEQQVETRTMELRAANVSLFAAKELAEQVAEMNAELSRRQHMILTAAGEGILGLDARGIVTFINPTGAAMFDLAVEQVVGKQLHDLIHPAAGNGDSDLCPMCRPAPLPRQRFNDTHMVAGRNGTRIPVEFVASPIIDEAGKRSGVVVTFRDITERLAIERMKNEFVSTVSHELRTPLTSIRGALGLLASGLIGEVSERAKRMIDIAISNTDRLVRLINDILDLERMKSGKVELNRVTVEATTLMKEAIDGVHSVAESAGVTLTMHPVDACLYVDRDRMIQTLTNLLGNAVKFSPSGTTVLLTGTVMPGHFQFSVQDHGRGIPADKIDSIFERFKQVDASDSREKGGSGLGLAICRTIVAAHGGKLWVESREQAGSTFHFTVPHQLSGEEEGFSPASATPAARSGSSAPVVLIVEDDLDLARVIAESLRRHGVETNHVTSGVDAIAACDRAVPAMVVLDLVIPHLDGFAVVHWMRSRKAMASLPLVVFSALEVSAADQEKLRLGPTEFLTKSRVPLDELAARVMKLLSGVTSGERLDAA